MKLVILIQTWVIHRMSMKFCQTCRPHFFLNTCHWSKWIEYWTVFRFFWNSWIFIVQISVQVISIKILTKVKMDSSKKLNLFIIAKERKVWKISYFHSKKVAKITIWSLRPSFCWHLWRLLEMRIQYESNRRGRQRCQKSLTPTWFEHATFWSGVRRATVAPQAPTMNDERGNKMPTTPGIPRRSPIQVLTGPDVA